MKKLLDKLKNDRYSIKLLAEEGLECITPSSKSKIALFVLDGCDTELIIGDMLQSSNELRILSINKNEVEMIKELSIL